MVDSVLAHHGIKGMKWGIRKDDGSGGGGGKGGSGGKASADHETAMGYKNRVKAGGVKTLSNKELQDLVNRMNLEQQHRNLMGNQPSKFDKGYGHVQKVLKVAKTLQEIHTMVNSPAGKALKKVGKEGYKKAVQLSTSAPAA